MTTAESLLAMVSVTPFHLHVDGETPATHTVYDGYVTVDSAAKVVAVPLPYLVFYSSTGKDNDVRQSGDVAGRVVHFQFTGVGGTREQSQWALDHARTFLSRKRLNGNLIIRDDFDLPVRRDDDYTQLGGLPLFYGVDRYSVAV